MPEEQQEKALTHDPKYHWDREEHLLLLDMYLKHKNQIPGKESTQVEEMSTLLRKYHQKKGNPVHEALRNQNGN
jgi:5-methylcytosine-specific restriction enzyme A